MHTIQSTGLWVVVYDYICQEIKPHELPLYGKSTLLMAFMMISWHGNTFHITGPLDSLTKGSVVWSFDVFFVAWTHYWTNSKVDSCFRIHGTIVMSLAAYRAWCTKSTLKGFVIKWNFNALPIQDCTLLMQTFTQSICSYKVLKLQLLRPWSRSIVNYSTQANNALSSANIEISQANRNLSFNFTEG